MEVHHHNNNHHSKNWKEYFLEFLMLFLAVSAGFIAENIREEYIEHNRAKNYSGFLINDLQKDKLVLDIIKKGRTNQIKINDSLMNELDKEILTRNDTILTQLCNEFTFHSNFTPFDATYKEMISSGALRYYDIEIVSELKSYEFYLKQIDILQNSETQFSTGVINPLKIQMVNAKFLESINNGKPYNGPTELMYSDEIHLNHIYNCARIEKTVASQILPILDSISVQNAAIIDLIKNKYHTGLDNTERE